MISAYLKYIYYLNYSKCIKFELYLLQNSYSVFIVTEIEFTGLNINFAFAIVHACYLAR